jgi:flavodoxin
MTEYGEFMKKKVVWGIAAICILLLAGCQSSQQTGQQVGQQTGQQDDFGKVLVLYYTWSKQGNTETAAKIIQSLTGADMIKVEPVTPFPELIEGDMIAWARKQWEDRAWPAIKDLGLDPASYDFIFIGTPVWFGTVALPIETLLANTDFGGKPVACFAMANSREGEVLSNFGKQVKNAQVKQGITFRMQNETELETKLAHWVNGIK